MRYYNIIISDPNTGKQIAAYSSLATATGLPDRGALNIELDVNTAPMSTPFGASYVRIWGISIQTISQAHNLNPNPDGTGYKQIQIYAGMSSGLPLANPAQSGLIVQGLIAQAFGNWIGTQMTLDLVIIAGGGQNAIDANLIVEWPAGTPLSAVIETSLKSAFPTYKYQINLGEGLVLNHDEQGFYGTITQFAQYIDNISQDIIQKTNYPGVKIFLKQNTFIVSDATTQSTPIKIAFQDLIGQPTWLNPNQITFDTVMRADVSVDDFISLPETQLTTTAQSYSQFRQGSIFSQGPFWVSAVRHIGNFRAPEGEAWITTFICSTTVN